MTHEWAAAIAALITAAAAAVVAFFGAVKLFASAKESRQVERARRAAAVAALREEYTLHAETFEGLMDYLEDPTTVALEPHRPRADGQKSSPFSKEEQRMRRAVDRALSHLANVQRQIDDRLIEPGDAGPWVYWFVACRQGAIKAYAEAVGFRRVLEESAKWITKTVEYRDLQTCGLEHITACTRELGPASAPPLAPGPRDS